MGKRWGGVVVKRIVATLVLLLLLCGLFLVASCGSTPTPTVTVTVTPSETANPNETPASELTETPTPEATPSDTALATVGDTITVDSYDTTLAVTLLASSPTLTHYDRDWIDPPKGRFVGLKFRIKNVGNKKYDDSYSNCVGVVNKAGEQFDAAWDEVAEPPLGSGKIMPGAWRQGWVTVDVSGTIDTVQFTPDSGSFEETVQWQLQ